MGAIFCPEGADPIADLPVRPSRTGERDDGQRTPE